MSLIADLNQDESVSSFDLSILLSNWNDSDAASDLNNDGTVNVFDLSILLSKWGNTSADLPATPGGLSANANDTQVTLSWDSVTGANTYTVKRSTTSGSGYTTLDAAVTNTVYIDTTVTEGTTYYYTVSASNQAGEGPAATEISATPGDAAEVIGTAGDYEIYAITASSFDESYVPENTIDDSLSTRWSARFEGEWIQYDLGSVQDLGLVSIAWYLGDERSSFFGIEVSSDGTNWTEVFNGTSSGSSLEPEDYDFIDTSGRYVRIVGYGNSVSNWNSITEVGIFSHTGSGSSGSLPVAPDGLSAVAGDTQVALSWNAINGTVSYTLKRSTVSGGPYTNVEAGITETTYTNSGLTNGTAYYYVVSATNAAGEGPNSSQVSATPQVPSGGGGGADGIWMSNDEIMALPTSGSAYNRVLSAANGSWGTANLGSDARDDHHNTYVLAGALIAVRNNSSSMATKTRNGIMAALGDSLDGATLDVGRKVGAYVIATDMLLNAGMLSSGDEATIRSELENIRTHSMPGHGSEDNNLLETALLSENNWGTSARFSMIAIDLFLGTHPNDLEDLVNTSKAFVGETAPNSITWTSTNWHANSGNKAGINRRGSTISGNDVDGVLPEEQRRTGDFTWPAPQGSYPWTALQGIVPIHAMLERAGLMNFDAGDDAIERALLWLRDENGNNSPAGHSTWVPFVVNHYLGTSLFTSVTPTDHQSSLLDWTDWTHA